MNPHEYDPQYHGELSDADQAAILCRLESILDDFAGNDPRRRSQVASYVNNVAALRLAKYARAQAMSDLIARAGRDHA